MPLPGGDDHCRALRPRPANCSPAMIIACGSGSSLSMHSVTMRRATRFVEATRGTTASDSMRFSPATIRLVSSSIMFWRAQGAGRGAQVMPSRRKPPAPCPLRSALSWLILKQRLDPCTQLGLPRLGLLHDRGRRIANELLVGQAGVDAGELVAALLDLALRPLDLLPRHDLRRKLDGDGEALHDVVLRPLRRLGVDDDGVEAGQLEQQVLVVAEERGVALGVDADVELEALLRR